MARLMFGRDEELVCIQDLAAPGPKGEKLCLAYKITRYCVGAPAYMSDDGYVLKVDGQTTYFPLDEARIHELQASETLPTPMPPYSIPAYKYAFGYLLWIAIALVVVLEVVRKRRNRAAEARDADVPVSHGPPEITTEGDRFIEEQAAENLEKGERVSHQAYALADAESVTSPVYFAILTDRRLLFIETRRGAFRPLLENKGVVAFARAEIKGVSRDGAELCVTFADGSVRTLVVVAGTKHFSNQAAFLRDLPRLLASSQ